MAPTIRISLPFMAVYSKASTPVVFIPATGWISTEKAAKIRATWEITAYQSDLNIAFSYQTCNVENSVDTAVQVGGWQSANGMVYPSTVTDSTSDTNGKQLVRFGWSVKTGGQTTLVFAVVGGVLELTARS